MSAAVDIADALLTVCELTILGVKTRNALTEGWIPADKVPREDFPFVQAFSVDQRAAPAEQGQMEREWDIQLLFLRTEDSGDAMWTDIETFDKYLREQDYRLGGLVDRCFTSAAAVDEVTDRTRTSGLITVSVGVLG